MSLVAKIKLNLVNIPGFRIKRKIVVFESDDWGAIRVSSKKNYKNLLKLGYKLDKCTYGANDMLESNEDLDRLFNTLSSYKDNHGNYAKLTFNNIIANPNFEKIKEANFKHYYYEPFTETLKKYPNHDRVIHKYNQAIEEGLINPQFHGREHLHVNNWMKALQEKESFAINAFNNNMFSIYRGGNSNCTKEYLDAFSTFKDEDYKTISKVLDEGLKLFEKIWGFKSKTIIAPCYSWDSKIESSFKENGIKTIQSGRVQKYRPTQTSKPNLIRRYTGQKNSLGMNYTVRNVIFEPSEKPNYDWVSTCMKEIKTAFFWGKPAIVSTHRVNYIGGLNIKNAENGLKKLETLLKKIIQKYPDVEFLTSDQLSDIISKK